MKYKILETPYHNGTIHEKLLKRSGIDNPIGYLNTSSVDLIGYNRLENINEAYNVLKKAIDNHAPICGIVDVDPDGYASSAILYSYIKEVFNVEMGFYHHTEKQHGLEDFSEQIRCDFNLGKVGLLIIADAGSNDLKACKELSELGLPIIILDHHEVNSENLYATVVNPQISKNYPNKYLSGTGVVYKFLKKIDDEQWENKADKYLDLVAMSIVSDSMDTRTFENRRLIELGFSNIRNEFLKALLNKQEFSTKGEISITNFAFYINPIINAVVRSGTMEEKELMFKAFCEQYDEFDYVKKDKSTIKENIYDRVARLAVNAKARQTRIVDKAMEEVEKDIQENNRNRNKILFCLANDNVEKTLSGLVAMKIAAKYNKPCVLLRDNKKDYFSGSIRNFNDSPLTNLKGFLESLDSVAWLAGHPQSAGIGLSKRQLILTINRSNEKLKDFDFSKIFNIDFEFDNLNTSAPSTQFLKELHDFRFYVGQGISEPLLLLKNIQINSQQISIFGKGAEKNIWKFPLTEEIDVIKFKCDETDYMLDKFGGSEFNWDGVELKLDVICKVGKSDFNGESKYTLIVEDYEIK